MFKSGYVLFSAGKVKKLFEKKLLGRRAIMSVEQRILTCRLIEKMKKQDSYGRQLGLKDTSTFCGIYIIKKEEEKNYIV